MRWLFLAAGVIFTAQTGAAAPSAGEKLFVLHCAACHGNEGRGGGSMAPALKLVPTDLTTLSQRHGGVFPTEQVVGQIDGRSDYAGHGGTMPVYGWFFEGSEATITLPDGTDIQTTQAIQNIIMWLQTRQKAP